MRNRPEMTDLLIQMSEARYPIKAMPEQYGARMLFLNGRRLSHAGYRWSEVA